MKKSILRWVAIGIVLILLSIIFKNPFLIAAGIFTLIVVYKINSIISGGIDSAQNNKKVKYFLVGLIVTSLIFVSSIIFYESLWLIYLLIAILLAIAHKFLKNEKAKNVISGILWALIILIPLSAWVNSVIHPGMLIL